MNKVFDQFKCNEDLFYTVYDYLRFMKPAKWKDIHSIDDLNYLLVEEMKDLATDAVNWLETLIDKIPVIAESTYDEKTTLYYMILSYMGKYHVWEPAYSLRNYENRKQLGVETVKWLRDNIEKIS